MCVGVYGDGDGGVSWQGGVMRGRLCGEGGEGGEDGWSAVGGKRGKTSAEQKTFRIN